MTFDFKSWYEKNGKEWNKKRRQRYAEDPAYRAKVGKWNEAGRLKRRGAVVLSGRAARRARKVASQEPWTEFEQDGVSYLTIGALARALGKSPRTLRLWEKRGWLPSARYATPKGVRLYTPGEILAMREVLALAGRVSEKGPQPRLAFVRKRARLADGRVEELVLFRIGALAEAAGKSAALLVRYEGCGWIPATPFRTPSGRRLYTFGQVEAVVEAFQWRAKQKKRPGRDAFRARIAEGWSRAGTDHASLCSEVSA